MRWQWAPLVWVLALTLVFARSMHAEVDVDEHPFVASAAVLARHGLLPYRDYHYNHMPTEVVIYAGLFRACSHLLLAARCFQVLCAATAVTVLFCVSEAAFAFLQPQVRLAVSAAVAALYLTNPLFIKTAGLCWNHDFPLLTALLGFLALRRAVSRARGAIPLAAIAGFLLGLSVTTRLTFAAAGPGFAVLVFLAPGLSRPRKAALLAVMAGGFVVASLPTVWVWMQAPRAAFFGNFLYPRLNTRIHELRDEHHRSTVLPILAYYLRSLVYLPGNGLLTASFAALAVRALRQRVRLGPQAFVQIGAVVTVAAGLLASGFMPAPPYPQYFYAAMPFILLGVILCGAAMPELLQWQRLRAPAVGAWLVCVAFGAVSYGGLAYLPRPRTWVPLKVHQIGARVAREAHARSVLTLEPIFPLEGGLDVDERLTTCRFGIRAAPLLEPRDRVAYRMPTALDFATLLHERHAAVLVVRGSDGRLERHMQQAAAAAGYEKVTMRDRGYIWRPAMIADPSK